MNIHLRGVDVHDSIISSYNVNFLDKSIRICSKDKNGNNSGTFIAREVLTHRFDYIIENNMLFSIEESPIESFFVDNSREIENGKNYCWPIDYQEPSGLVKFLNEERLKYIKIEASFGLSGWILAKSYEIELE